MSLIEIMIPTIDSRGILLNGLIYELHKQIENENANNDISISILTEHQNLSVGERRNILLQNAKSKYVCFFDDDDMPTDFYIKRIYEGAKSGADCCSLKGIYTVNGQNPEIFEHSINYKEWKTVENTLYPNVKYERPPNHLNCIKSEIAKSIHYNHINFGEDKIWSDAVFNTGLIKTEFPINEIIYQYLKII